MRNFITTFIRRLFLSMIFAYGIAASQSATLPDASRELSECVFLSPSSTVEGGMDSIKASGPEPFQVQLPVEPKNATQALVTDFGASPESSDNWKAFTDAITHCRLNGIQQLIIPPGTYRFTTRKPLSIEGLTDFVLDGQGADLVFLYPVGGHAAMVEITDCHRTLVKNLTVEWDAEADPIASFVEVVQVDPEARHVDIRFTGWDRFPKRDVEVISLNPIDEKTGALGRPDVLWTGGWRLTGETSWIDDNTMRLFFKPDQKIFLTKHYREGLPLRVSHYRYDLSGIKLENTSQLTMQDITIHATPGHGISGGVDVHHLAMRRVRVLRRPGPRNAISSCNDQLHFYNTQGFLLFDDCEFADGGDDGINIHDNSSSGVTVVNRHTLNLRNVRQWSHTIREGDEIELRHSDLSPLGYKSRIQSYTWDTAASDCRVSLADDIPEGLPKDAVVFYRGFDSHNIIIRNCVFRDNRGRGILVQGRGMLIEGCRFLRTQLAGLIITSGTEKRWSEGFGASNIIIRDNLFSGCNTMARGYYEWPPYDTLDRSAVIYLRTYTGRTDYPIFQNVLIERNHFINPPKELMFLSSVRGIAVRDNVFQTPDSHLLASPLRGVIEVRQAQDVAVTGNTWETSVYTPNAGIFYDAKSVTGLLVKDNRIQPSGEDKK